MTAPDQPGQASGMYPSVPAIAFVIWTVVIPSLFARRILNVDGDLPHHIRHGEWMLTHHALLRVDLFSYTMAGKPFLGFEYASQLVYALVHRAGGFAAVIIVVSLLLATTYALVARFLLVRQVDPLLTYLIALAVGVLGAVHWAARPHLFTLLAVAALLPFLEPSERRPHLWFIIPLFVVWANFHGGFVFGLLLLVIYFVGSALEWWSGTDRPRWAGAMRYYASALGLALLATLVNPHGYELHRHIVHFFSEPFIRDNTQEFLSPDFHAASGKIFLAALLIVLTVLALARERPMFPRLLLLLTNVAFALVAYRNVALFAITVFPTLALQYDAAWRRLPDWRGLRAIFARDARRGSTAPTVIPVLGVLVAIALLRGKVGPLRVVPDQLDPEEFPVAAVDWARSQEIRGRIFHDFVWGGYLLYAWPEQRIFIDGNTDFYGAELMRTYLTVHDLRPGWRSILARWDISVILMPTPSAIVAELVRDGAWRIRYCDRVAALLEQDSSADREVETARLSHCNSHPLHHHTVHAPSTAT